VSSRIRQQQAPVVEVSGLTRRFGARVAVDDVSLTVLRGEIFGFLGPNGAGKSTLLRMLLGLLAPSAGTARVLGHAIPADSERLRSRVGYMTQQFTLYTELSVTENLEFAAAIFGLSRRARRERVALVLAESGLAQYADTRAESLSGGWKQRLALVAATLHAPELLVLDEPTAGVDPQSRRLFWERLFELAAAGTTILVSTHYMDEAVRCHRLCMLRDGRRAALGRPHDLTGALADRVVEMRVDAPERAAIALRGTPSVASSTQLGDALHVLVAPGGPPAADAAVELERALTARGFHVLGAAPCPPTLEDAFVALMLGERIDAHERGGAVTARM
jgi:ABC-2 type transport system ATP-binding protein